MSENEQIDAGAPTLGKFTPSVDKSWGGEARALFLLGAPMALTQIVQFSINSIDVLMIGRLGPDALAASSLGLLFFFSTWLLGYGPAMAVSPLVSQSIGAAAAGKEEGLGDDVRRSVRMGLWGIALLTPFVTVLFFFAPAICRALGQPPELAEIARPYVIALAPAWPFSIGILVLRNFLAAIERTQFPLLLVVCTTALNAFLNYLLIFGALGAPKLGLLGAGIASSISNAAGFFALAAYCNRDPRARAYDIWRDVFAPDWERLREVARLGWPIAVTTAFEGMLFNASVLLMGRIGVDEMAAYQVALNVAAMAFMAAFGFAMAGSVRVGLHAGAADRPGVRRAAALAIAFAIGAIACIAAPVFAAPNAVAGLYLDRTASENAAVLPLVESFLKIAAAFMLFDAVQAAANQALRGLKDVRAPMLITGVAYWGVGFPLAAYLGLMTPIGADGVWWGLLTSLGVAAALLSARLAYMVR
ncbi:MAG: MATE family efflux transporter [Pseudomonadota bacterium]